MEGKKPYLIIVLIQAIYAGMHLLSKAALSGGMMTSFVFIFYRQATATIFLLPFAIIFGRKKAPPLSFVAFCKIFMISLLGITTCMNIYGIAIIHTSATLAAAISNMLPAITFFLAVLLRTETINLRTLSGIAKIVGVVLCTAGAATLAFYKGPHLKPLMHHHFFGHHQGDSKQDDQLLTHSTKTWVKGCFLMLSANILWGLWIVLQVRVFESYPSKLLSTTLQCFLSAIQSFIIAIALEKNSYSWKLHLDVGLFAVAYTGIVVTGFTFYLQAWCIEKKGPVFLAMSSPLSLVITIFCSAFLLGEIISLGSVLGGIFLVGGLYSVLWGKSKEQMNGTLTVEEEVSEEQRDVRFVVEDDKTIA